MSMNLALSDRKQNQDTCMHLIGSWKGKYRVMLVSDMAGFRMLSGLSFWYCSTMVTSSIVLTSRVTGWFTFWEFLQSPGGHSDWSQPGSHAHPKPVTILRVWNSLIGPDYSLPWGAWVGVAVKRGWNCKKEYKAVMKNTTNQWVLADRNIPALPWHPTLSPYALDGLLLRWTSIPLFHQHAFAYAFFPAPVFHLSHLNPPVHFGLLHTFLE